MTRIGKPRRAAPLAVLAALGLIACRWTETAETAETVEAIQGQPVSAWLITGPFAVIGLTGLEDGLDHDYFAETGKAENPASEADVSASLFRAAGTGSVSWRYADAGMEAAEAYTGVDFLAEFGSVTAAVAYAYRDIEAPEGRRAELKVGSDDGIKIWLNGEIVLARHVQRALTPGEDSAMVTLRAGSNRLLVKLEQLTGGWGFMLKLEPPPEGEADIDPIESLAAFPDRRVLPAGSVIDGRLSATPARYSDGSARIDLVDLHGRAIATTEARIGERFAVQAPAELTGLFYLKATGLGPSAAAASGMETVVLGEAASVVAAAAAEARAAAATASAKTAAAADGQSGLAATLEFLARAVEGRLPAALAGYGKAAAALKEINAIVSARPGSGEFPEGLWRYAYVSSLDGSLQPYTLYLPPGYDRAKRYGLMVALHGATGNDYDYGKALAAGAPADLLIVSPFGRGDLSYVGAGERDVLDVIDLVCSAYSIDPDRIYLTGSSMGGFGAWRLAQLYPWRFAAVVPFAGWTFAGLLDNIVGLPVLAVHGDQDTVIPYASDATAVQYLVSKGGDAALDLLSGAGHSAFSAWTKDEGPSRLYDWFRRRERVAWPKSLMMRTSMARTGKAAWASILGLLDNREMAGLDARIVDERRIAVDTDNVSAFALDLRHPDLAKGGRILILADGFNLTADSGNVEARFELGPNGRFRTAAAADRNVAANSGAGIAAIFDGPLRVVYGTKKRASAAANEETARAIAAAFDGLLSVEVMSDVEAETYSAEAYNAEAYSAEADGADLNYSRFLVGESDDCPPMARVLAGLPIIREKDRWRIAAESGGGAVTAPGLLLVYPDPLRPGRLVAVFSLPLTAENALGFAAALAAPFRSGAANDPCGFKLPDVMLLDASGSTVWSGFFDWRWTKLQGFPL